MVKDLVGYRFSPTGEELINHYLKNKILGNTWLVNEAISDINIYSYDPIYLPSLSRIRSDDPVWYFFSRKEYTSVKKKVIKRTTSSGYWKGTGLDRKIKDKRGNKGEIGIKKTLVYYEGRVSNGVWTPWVMHEYHITCLPPHQREYVICQVMYKGEDEVFPSVNNQSEPSQSLISDLSTVRAMNTESEFNGISVDDLRSPMNEQQDQSMWDVLHPDMFDNNPPTLKPQAPVLAPNDDEFLGELRHVAREQVEYLFVNEEFISGPTIYMQEDRNCHRPKKALTGIICDDSDSDAESISETSYQGTSSPGDSVGSSDRRHSQTGLNEILSKDLQTYDEPYIRKKTRASQLTRRTIPSKLELQVKQVTSRAAAYASLDKESSASSIVKTEKKGFLIITEEAIEKNQKKPRYVYLVNTIIGFILLLALVSNIISALFTVKT